jgi:hypothetical protein
VPWRVAVVSVGVLAESEIWAQALGTDICQRRTQEGYLRSDWACQHWSQAVLAELPEGVRCDGGFMHIVTDAFFQLCSSLAP